MGLEKESAKNGGGYAGGFFQLFDWTAKSRKKLFSSKSYLPENSKLGTKGNEKIAMANHPIDGAERGAGLCSITSNEYSCSSSVTDDDGCGIKAPGVVARLMGLDSLPTSHLCEPYANPTFDTQSVSLSNAHYTRRNIDYQHDYEMYSRNFHSKVDIPARNILQSKQQKMLNKPIEKFQTEVLPPKSAKSIPTTHHKLLSPIKSPGFIPSKNAAHIMEAASKILEYGPRATTKAKLPLFGSSSTPLKLQTPKEKALALQKLPLVVSSLPLKVRELKEKVEVSQKSDRFSEISKRPSEISKRPSESNAARILKGQSMNKSWNGSPETLFRVSPDSEYSSRSKCKSVSLAIQAKVNVQQREGVSTSGNGNLEGQKRQIEVKSSHLFESQPNVKINLQAKSSAASGVLRNNNQKQNCLVVGDKLLSKPPVSNFQVKKTPTKDSSFLQHKNSGRANGKSKMVVRKSGIEATYGENEDLYCRSKNFPRKKRSIDRDFVFDKSQVMDSVLSEKNWAPNHLNTSVNQPYNWGDANNKGTDVVSFTFTAPLTRQTPCSGISSQTDEESYNLGRDHRGKRGFLDSNSMKLTSVGYNMIGDDTLSSLLDKKLREPTDRVESSHCNSTRALAASNSASTQQLLINHNGVDKMPMLYGKRNEYGFVDERCAGQYDSDVSSTGSPTIRHKHKFQRTIEDDECSSNSIDSGKLLSHRHPSPVSILKPSFSSESFNSSMSTESNSIDSGKLLSRQHPSPVSILKPSFSSESCNSSMSTESNSIEGSKLCWYVQAQEVDLNSSIVHLVKTDTELLDSASSLSTGVMVRQHLSMLTLTDHAGAFEWELEYVKEILFCDELMFENFALSQSGEIIKPNQFFDQLESRRGCVESDGGESRLKRKLLFDCVSEFVELKCRRHASVGYKEWERGVEVLKRKEGVAKEVYKEILGWRGLGDCMVDELVDKDMSSRHGRWLDFGVDASTLGVEVEDQIVSSLVDEVIAELFLAS